MSPLAVNSRCSLHVDNPYLSRVLPCYRHMIPDTADIGDHGAASSPDFSFIHGLWFLYPSEYPEISCIHDYGAAGISVTGDDVPAIHTDG